MVWWINNIFWPNNIKNHGNFYCISLMKNCAAHIGLYKKNVCRDCGIPEKLIVIFLLPTVTSFYHPINMGIIICFKVGYFVQLREYLL